MIVVKLYATLRENRGKEVKINYREGLTVENILNETNINSKDVSIILINGVHQNLDTELNEGDKLLLFPPVGGG